jgi:hypothetical protein
MDPSRLKNALLVLEICRQPMTENPSVDFEFLLVQATDERLFGTFALSLRSTAFAKRRIRNLPNEPLLYEM